MSQMTKRALVASLKELMAEKPLDKITVTDLTEHCGVADVLAHRKVDKLHG